MSAPVQRIALLAALLLAPAPARAITRCEVIDRAQSWVDSKVPYSQSQWFSNEFGSYRQDCSGYVSMAWALSSSMVTSTLPQVSTKLGSFDELQPGDAVNHTCCHVMLFKKWIQPGVSFEVYEEQNWGTVANIYTKSVSSLKSQGYAPYRLNGIKECCERHCEGSVVVGDDCGKHDCAPEGGTCVGDSLGVRCVATACAGAAGAHEVCLADGKIASCTAQGALTNQRSCPSGQQCKTEGASAACIAPVAPPPPKPKTDLGVEPPPAAVAPTQDGGPTPSLPVEPDPSALQPEPGELQGGCSIAGGRDGEPGLVLLALIALRLRRRRR